MGNGDVMILRETPTLRDIFAKAALQGFLAAHGPLTGDTYFPARYAKEAYAYADAMLEEREKNATVAYSPTVPCSNDGKS